MPCCPRALLGPHSRQTGISTFPTPTLGTQDELCVGQPEDNPHSPQSLLPTVPGEHQKTTTTGSDTQPARPAAATITYSLLPKKTPSGKKKLCSGAHGDGCCYRVGSTPRSSELGTSPTTFPFCPASFQSTLRPKPEFRKQHHPYSLSPSSSLLLGIYSLRVPQT